MPIPLNCNVPRDGPCRLHVGYRQGDFLPVYAVHGPPPATEEETDSRRKKKDDQPRYYFEVVTKEKEWAQIREGEIAWLPFFNPIYMEAGDQKTRLAIANETLLQALNYLSEKDKKALKALETDLGKRTATRWAVWFKRAKQSKTAQMKRVDRYVARQVARGIPARQAREQYDWDADQGYFSADGGEDDDDEDDDDDNDNSQGGAAASSMPPPPRPGHAGSRRPATNSQSNGAHRPAQRRRLNGDIDGRPRFSASGARESSVGSSRNNELDDFGNDGDDDSNDDDDESLDYDTRPPEGRTPSILGRDSALDLPLRTPPPTGQRPQVDFLRTSAPAQRAASNNGTNQGPGAAGNRTRQSSPERFVEYNGGDVTEEQAFERAQRESSEMPQNNRHRAGNGDADDEDDPELQRAIRASLAPEDRGERSVHQSIEHDDQMSVH